jgi:hypothetical protein
MTAHQRNAGWITGRSFVPWGNAEGQGKQTTG